MLVDVIKGAGGLQHGQPVDALVCRASTRCHMGIGLELFLLVIRNMAIAAAPHHQSVGTTH